MLTLLLAAIALLYAATLLAIRRAGRADLAAFHQIVSEYVRVIERRYADVRGELLDAKERLKATDDVSDARASINADSHAEFRNRLDTVEARVDQTVKVVADNFFTAKKPAKKGR